jgi:hypothetical protein
MLIILQRFVKFFEINFGSFFINGQKTEWWENYIQQKYFNDNSTKWTKRDSSR